MRELLAVISGLVMAAAATAEPPLRHLGRVEDHQQPAPWVMRAFTSATDILEAEALAAETGAKPIALLETNYYTFLPGENLQLRLSSSANGYGAPVTMYLYRQDRATGAKRYYNVAGGLLGEGEVSDLFGSVGAPVPINVPELSDFVLFGSANDPATLSWGLDGALGGSITAPSETGLFQYVVEFRDAAGKRVVSKSNAMYSWISQSVTVSGTINSNTAWTRDKRYVLSGFVQVLQPAVLTIEPGTVIYGGDTQAALFITHGARIIADGTAMRPIVFTSPQKVGSRAQRDWGSLIVLGNAPINEPGGQAVLEGLPSQPQYTFGGSTPTENSGIIRYVRLEFGGFEIAVNQEINGLTLGGVGSGTLIDYVQVAFNKDDAVEFFGGTVNAKHLLFTGIADDCVDWDLGWVGNVQFVVNIKSNKNPESDSNIMIEGDNHPLTFDSTPRTSPQVYNMTAVGTGTAVTGAFGATLRRGTAGKIHNIVIQTPRRAPVTLRDDATWNQATAGELVFDNSILYGNFADGSDQWPSSSDRPQQTRDFIFNTMKHNRNVDPMLTMGAWSALDFLMPDVTPLPGSPALDINYVKTPPDNGFFDTTVDYIGGVGPTHNWTMTGWAVFSDN
jgi:hypothetical protein